MNDFEQNTILKINIDNEINKNHPKDILFIIHDDKIIIVDRELSHVELTFDEYKAFVDKYLFLKYIDSSITKSFLSNYYFFHSPIAIVFTIPVKNGERLVHIVTNTEEEMLQVKNEMKWVRDVIRDLK